MPAERCAFDEPSRPKGRHGDPVGRCFDRQAGLPFGPSSPQSAAENGFGVSRWITPINPNQSDAVHWLRSVSVGGVRRAEVHDALSGQPLARAIE